MQFTLAVIPLGGSNRKHYCKKGSLDHWFPILYLLLLSFPASTNCLTITANPEPERAPEGSIPLSHGSPDWAFPRPWGDSYPHTLQKVTFWTRSCVKKEPPNCPFSTVLRGGCHKQRNNVKVCRCVIASSLK